MRSILCTPRSAQEPMLTLPALAPMHACNHGSKHGTTAYNYNHEPRHPLIEANCCRDSFSSSHIVFRLCSAHCAAANVYRHPPTRHTPPVHRFNCNPTATIQPVQSIQQYTMRLLSCCSVRSRRWRGWRNGAHACRPFQSTSRREVLA